MFKGRYYGPYCAISGTESVLLMGLILHLLFQIDVHTVHHTQLFPKDKTIYLTPDADKPLTDIDKDKIYIIGGLVDESVSKVRRQKMVVVVFCSVALSHSFYINEGENDTHVQFIPFVKTMVDPYEECHLTIVVSKHFMIHHENISV